MEFKLTSFIALAVLASNVAAGPPVCTGSSYGTIDWMHPIYEDKQYTVVDTQCNSITVVASISGGLDVNDNHYSCSSALPNQFCFGLLVSSCCG